MSAKHVRTQIRQAVLARLTGLATTQDRAFQSRIHPLARDLKNGVLIYNGDDRGVGNDLKRQAGRPLFFKFTINVEAFVKESALADETLDRICLEVQAALAADLTLGGLVHDIQLESTGDFGLHGDGETPLSTCKMEFAALYIIAENDPGTAI